LRGVSQYQAVCPPPRLNRHGGELTIPFPASHQLRPRLRSFVAHYPLPRPFSPFELYPRGIVVFLCISSSKLRPIFSFALTAKLMSFHPLSKGPLSTRSRQAHRISSLEGIGIPRSFLYSSGALLVFYSYLRKRRSVPVSIAAGFTAYDPPPASTETALLGFPWTARF